MRRLKAISLLWLVFLVAPAWAQISSSTGAIQGTVTDPGGGVVPGARVVATNNNTGTTSETVTQSDGTYTFALLPPGTYKIQIEAPNFQVTVLSDIPVQVTKTTTANAQLQLGAIGTQVVVTEAAQPVETRSPTVGEVITGDLIRQLGLPTRNFLFLTTLEPGVSATLVSPATSGRGTPTVFASGQRGTSNNYVLDGVDANNFGNNNLGNVPVPNPDAVGEFRVSTSLYDATQGRNSGGNINAILRSGTNTLHGSVYEFYRSNRLNANDFFFNRNGAPRPVLLQNQFGAAVGGPIPRLAETFWFISYQGTRQKNGVAGAISGSQPALPAVRNAANLAAAFGIPAANIDPVAVNWLNRPGPYGGLLYPSAADVPAGQIGRISFSAPSIFNEDQGSARIDRQLFANNRLAVMYFQAIGQTRNPIGGGVSLGQGQASPIKNYHAAASDTHTFGPTLINEARAGFTLNRAATIPVENTRLGDIGMSRFNQGFFPGVPGVFFLNGLLSWGGINTNNDQRSGTLSYTVSDTLSYTRGLHTVRVGFDFRRYHFNIINNFASRGALIFANFTDFLQGRPFQTFVGTGITDRAFRAFDLSGYVQDDFRVTPKLTLNLGLRYDYLSPSVDIRGRIGNFDPFLLSPETLAIGGPGLRAGFISPEELAGFGTPGVSSSTFVNKNRRNWAPRFGIAYDVFGDGRLAIRSGYGIYYIRTSGQTLLQGITGVPFFQLSSLVNFPIGAGALGNPFPALPTPSAFPRLPAFPTFLGFNAAGAPVFDQPLLTLNPIERTLSTPYAQHWNLTVQYGFIKNWVAEVGYLGSRGVHLLAGRQLNEALLVNAANPGLGGLTVNSSRNASARVPVPGFSPTGLNMTTSSGDSWYHGLVISVRHPFSTRLNFGAHYTFSKALDTNSGSATQDLGNPGGNQYITRFNKGLSDFDQRHRFVATYLYEIPGPTQGWASHVLGGWSVTGTTYLQSGFPFDVYTNTGGSLAGAPGDARANLLGCAGQLTADGSPRRNLDNYILRSCFAAPPTLAPGTVIGPTSPIQGPGNQFYTIGGVGTDTTGGSLFGNLGRNRLREPFQTRFDFTLAKAFRLPSLGEERNIQFRTDFFKVFNNPIFAMPNRFVESASFGRITSTTDNTGRVIQFGLKLNF